MSTQRPGTPRIVRLKPRDRQDLEEFLRSQVASARERVRARILLLSALGWDRESIATATGSSTSTVGRVRRQFCEDGLAAALGELPRPGAAPKLTARQEQRVVALACTDAPEGFSRWSVRLLTAEATRRGIVSDVSRERIRLVLHEHGIKPWREKNVVHPASG